MVGAVIGAGRGAARWHSVAGRGGRQAGPCRRTPTLRIRLKPDDASQTLTSLERRFLRARLDWMEHAAAPVVVRAGHGVVGRARCPAAVETIVARGLATVAFEEGYMVMRLTDRGQRALGLWLASQPANFRVRCPALYRQLVDGGEVESPETCHCRALSV